MHHSMNLSQGGYSSSIRVRLVSRLSVSKVSVTGIGGVVVAKPKSVVTFGLVSRLRVSKVSSVTGIVVMKCRTVSHFWTRLGSSRLESVNNHRDRGGCGHETQNCRHFWTIFGSSTVTGIGGLVVVKCRTVVTFGFVSRFRVSKVSTVIGIRGGRGRETQICRPFWTIFGSSTVTGIGRVVVAKCRTVVTFGFVSRFRVSKSVNSDRDREGRETQICRHFWTRLASVFRKCQLFQGLGRSWL